MPLATRKIPWKSESIIKNKSSWQMTEAASPTRVRSLVIGCGNILRGDDAAGPVCIRRIWERGLPAGVHCADGGTGGMDVAFQMRAVPCVILIDACQTGSEPGTIFEVPGREVESLPPLTGINLHAFRWDHALAFGRWLLKDEYPQHVMVYLIEGRAYQIGAPLSEPVSQAIDRVVDRLFEQNFEFRHTTSTPRKPACPVDRQPPLAARNHPQRLNARNTDVA